MPKDLLYLELGLTPIPYIIKVRKIMFLHHILIQKEDSLLFRFFPAQISNPTTGDWVSEVLNDLVELDIEMELSEISGISKNKFRSIVKEQTNKKALQHLLDRKASRTSVHAKGKAIEYSDLSMAEYLSPSDLDISIDDKKWLFKCRTEDIDLSSNRR